MLINYMNERYIRPSELFRIMDKDVDAMMTEDEFIQRLKVGSNALQTQHYNFDCGSKFIKVKSKSDVFFRWKDSNCLTMK